MLPILIIAARSTSPTSARPLRGIVLSLREREFIQAAIGSGASDLRILCEGDPAQRRAEHHRLPAPHGGLRHAHRVGAVLPRHRRPAAQRQLGHDHQRRARAALHAARGWRSPRASCIVITAIALNILGDGVARRLRPQGQAAGVDLDALVHRPRRDRLGGPGACSRSACWCSSSSSRLPASTPRRGSPDAGATPQILGPGARTPSGSTAPLPIRYVLMMDHLFIKQRPDLVRRTSGDKVVPQICRRRARHAVAGLRRGGDLAHRRRRWAASSPPRTGASSSIPLIMFLGIAAVSVPAYWLGEVVNSDHPEQVPLVGLLVGAVVGLRVDRPRTRGSGRCTCSSRGSRWRPSTRASTRACCAPSWSTP